MQRRDLGIAAAVVVAAVLMVTAGFEIGSRARARQAASSAVAPPAVPAPASTTGAPGEAATDPGGTAPGSGTEPWCEGRPATGWAGGPATGRAGGPCTGGASGAVGAPVPATGRLLAAPPAPARIAAATGAAEGTGTGDGTGTTGDGGLTCARLQARLTGLVPAACGRVALAPSGRPVVWVSGRVPGSQALALQVWSPAGGGFWQQSLVAAEPRPARTWAAIRVATPALSAQGRTLLAQFRSKGPDQLLAYDLVSFPGSGPPVVAAHRGRLARGTVRVTQTAAGMAVLDEYAAGRPDAAGAGGGPGAPGPLVHTRIGLVAGSFRYLSDDRTPVPTRPPPPAG